ncbi:MAG: ABC transporter permease [Anaerolineales bacterium]
MPKKQMNAQEAASLTERSKVFFATFFQRGKGLVKVALTLLLALLMGAIVIELSGKDALSAYKVLFNSALGGRNQIANTLNAATPLIFTAVAIALSFRAGVFNIGIQGSLYLGAFAAAWVGFSLTNVPGVLLIPLCFLAAFIVGGIWCYIPGVLLARLDVNEVVTTILLNYVAIFFTSYLVIYPFRVPGLANAMSEMVVEQARLPRFAPPSQLNLSFILAVLTAFTVGFLISKTTLGFELKSTGDNPLFARWAGMKVPNIIEKIMFLSGAIGGLAGAGQILGVHYRFIANFSPGYTWDGLAIALLVRNSPIGALFGALLFGVLRNGTSTMAVYTDVPRDLLNILIATVIFFSAIEFSLEWFKKG